MPLRPDPALNLILSITLTLSPSPSPKLLLTPPLTLPLPLTLLLPLPHPYPYPCLTSPYPQVDQQILVTVEGGIPGSKEATDKASVLPGKAKPRFEVWVRS